MKSKIVVLSSVIGALITLPVYADEGNLSATATREGPRVSSGIELGVSTGYAQAFGKVASAQPKLTDSAGPGGAIEIDIGYRVIPNLTVGAFVSGADFSVPDSGPTNSNQYSMTAGAQAIVHLIPDGTWDPWVSIGSGWRGYWTKTDVVGTTSRHGLELGRLQFGVDYRISDSVAISPLVGADLSLFLTEQRAGSNDWTNVQDPNINTFVYGAVAARFDVATN